MSEAPAPADAGARSAAVDSHASVLVQAPAGAGKTTLLTQRYLRLLSEVDRPERILALTFTRRAAQEMRERVLQALRSVRDETSAAAMNPRTRALAQAANRHLDELGLDLDAQPSRLRIETIDAFNAWLASQLPVGAGMGAGFRVLTDAGACYREAAQQALAYDEADAFGAAVETVLALDDQRWSALVDLIAAMLPHRDRWLPLLTGPLQAMHALDAEQLGELRRHFDEDLRMLVERVLDRAHALLSTEQLDALAAVACAAAQRVAAQKPALSPWIDDATRVRCDATDLERWRCLAELLLTRKGDYRARFVMSDGFPRESADKLRVTELVQELNKDPRILDVLREIRTLPPARYSDEQWPRVRAVAQVLVLAAAELQNVFRDRSAVDFTAVSMAALRSLGSADAPTDLGLRLDYRLRHILMDEFQDTSSSQLELLRSLTAGWQPDDGRSVFCVGDPMQSIYGFRQAEVRAFLELADDGIGEIKFGVQRLTTNFRSSEGIVSWNNACFAHIMPRSDDRARGAIAFRPSIATRNDSGGVEVRAFANTAEEAEMIAASVARALAENPAWRVAVLVRAKSHARAILAAFRRQCMNFHAVDIEPSGNRHVVRDIVSLTCALLHFGDRISWLALLRAPWAGMILGDLLVVSGHPATVWEALQDPAVCAALSADGRPRVARVVATLAAAMQSRAQMSLARWIESTWLSLGGASCLKGAEELELARVAFARLREIEEEGLPDVTQLADRFGDLFVAPLGAARVEVMSIHKAKGLEFDMVVLPALERRTPPQRGQMLLVHEFARAGRDGFVMAARAALGAEHDPLFEFLRLQVRDAADLESQRLAYVACTRAKRRLLLTATTREAMAPGESDERAEAAAGERPFQPASGSLLKVLWPVVGAAMRDAQTTSSGAAADTPRGGPLWRLPRDFSIPSFGAFDAALERPARGDAPVFDWAGETARRIGTLVHAELQALELTDLGAEAVRAREAYHRHWLTLHGVPATRLDDAVQRVAAALLAVRDDARGRWMLMRGYEDDWREHALSAHVGGHLVHAVFDRSFIDAGTRWVIDYKTSQHTGGGIDTFLASEVERYRPQLERYALLARLLGPQPVRVGLYFPLMRAWREWAP